MQHCPSSVYACVYIYACCVCTTFGVFLLFKLLPFFVLTSPTFVPSTFFTPFCTRSSDIHRISQAISFSLSPPVSVDRTQGRQGNTQQEAKKSLAPRSASLKACTFFASLFLSAVCCSSARVCCGETVLPPPVFFFPVTRSSYSSLFFPPESGQR